MTRARLAAVVFVLAARCALGADLWLGPYLQDVRDDRAAVLWATRGGAGAGLVRFTAGQGTREAASVSVAHAASEASFSETLYLHRADLTGLLPDTDYRYSVLVDGAAMAAGRTLGFHTPGVARPIRFLVFGDTGDAGAGQEIVARAIEQEPADFLLHTGDIAYWEGTFPQFQDGFFRIYDKMLGRLPFFPVPGNHDTIAGATAYRTFFQPPQEGAGKPIETSAAVLAPGYAGLYQVNVRIPSATATGVLTLQLTCGGASSAAVTLPVR